MAAIAPATMPRSSFWSLSVISAWASAISSRTRSCTFSVTSWIAWPSSETWGSVIVAGDRSDEAGEEERAGERRADQQLGPLRCALGRRGLGRRGGRGRGALLRGAALRRERLALGLLGLRARLEG